MSSSEVETRAGSDVVVGRSIEAAIRIGAIAILAFWVFEIIAPFISPVLWGAIIAIAVYPVFRRLQRWLGGRGVLAASVFTILALLLLITPTVALTRALIEWGGSAANQIDSGNIYVPAPPASVADWPVIGETVHEYWSLAHSNLREALRSLDAQLKVVGKWIVSAVASAGIGVVHFTLSIIISGVFLANAEAGERLARQLFVRLAPERGVGFAQLAGQTVRGVASGVIGVAVIQSALAAAGFFAAGVPGTPFWALLCLLLGVVQLPLGIVMVPIIAYVWFTDSTGTSVLLTLWSVPVMLLDNFLKPLLMGRGVEAPMLVIFIGAIGGFIASGIIGLFSGAVILVLAYELFRSWLETPQE